MTKKRINHVVVVLALAWLTTLPAGNVMEATLGPNCSCFEVEDVMAWCDGWCQGKLGCVEWTCEPEGCYAGLCAWSCTLICGNGAPRARFWFWHCADCPH